MMSSSNPHPKWWQLYLLLPLLIALFIVDSRMRLAQRGHIVVQIGILLFVYELVHLWLKANTIALMKMDQSQYQGTITVIRIPPYELSDAGKDKRSMFQLSDFEIKSVLSDRIEIDYIDMDSFPVDEVPQEINKE
jgi:hypothetical protein